MIKKFTSIEEVSNIANDDVFKPKITVIGVGGAGTNAVNNMIDMDLQGVKFIVINTDSQSLERSICSNKIQIGPKVTKGLGAGSRPEIGIQAAEESTEDIKNALDGTNMLFITCGMGGGTGTGASQVIAKIAKDMGILSIAFITKPFDFEGSQRLDISLLGVAELEKVVDALVVISNQNLFRVIEPNTSMMNAFRVTDSVLYSGVKAITDLLISNGLVNLDFNDIRSVIENTGRTMIGAAEASGGDRAEIVAKAAILNPLLEEVSICGAKRALINITGGDDMTLFEIDEIINLIKLELSEEAFINFGTVYDENMTDKIRVSIVATGLDTNFKPLEQTPPKISPKIRMKIEENEDNEEDEAKPVYSNIRADNVERQRPPRRTRVDEEQPRRKLRPVLEDSEPLRKPQENFEKTVGVEAVSTYQKSVAFYNNQENEEDIDSNEIEEDFEEDRFEADDSVFEERIKQESASDAEYAKQKVDRQVLKNEEFFEENEAEEVGLFELIAKKNKHEEEAKKRNSLNEEELLQIKNRDKFMQKNSPKEENSFFDLPSFLKKKK
ncbi:MAG: cell division protein FtsZ [Alphaproteobacteria bacterium]|nr:cell division protein FtsZ [Alphaproteobacteria bacterium]